MDIRRPFKKSASAVAGAIALMFMGSTLHAETYLCTADLSTGFRFDQGQWNIARFKTNSDRFIVYSIDSGQTKYEVKRVGSDKIQHKCERPWLSDRVHSHRIICGGQGIGFMLDLLTLRFQSIYGIGFIGGEDGPDDTPALTIGKCSTIPGR